MVITLIGSYLFLSGILRVVFRVQEWRREKELCETGLRTTGRIIDRVTYPQVDDLQSSQYRLIAEFADENGDKHHVRSRGHMCGSESRKAIGSSFDIMYRKNHPEKSMFLSDRRSGVSIWTIAGNTISVLFGALLLLSQMLS